MIRPHRLLDPCGEREHRGGNAKKLRLSIKRVNNRYNSLRFLFFIIPIHDTSTLYLCDIIIPLYENLKSFCINRTDEKIYFDIVLCEFFTALFV